MFVQYRRQRRRPLLPQASHLQSPTYSIDNINAWPTKPSPLATPAVSATQPGSIGNSAPATYQFYKSSNPGLDTYSNYQPQQPPALADNLVSSPGSTALGQQATQGGQVYGGSAPMGQQYQATAAGVANNDMSQDTTQAPNYQQQFT